MTPVPTMHPSRRALAFSGDGGITSATGLPKRVTRIGFRVLRTSSRMPRHLALNTGVATFFIYSVYTMVNDHCQLFGIAKKVLPSKHITFGQVVHVPANT